MGITYLNLINQIIPWIKKKQKTLSESLNHRILYKIT